MTVTAPIQLYAFEHGNALHLSLVSLGLCSTCSLPESIADTFLLSQTRCEQSCDSKPRRVSADMATRKEMDLTGLYDLTTNTTRTRPSRSSPFRVPSSIPGRKTAETRRLTVPDAINDHRPSTARSALKIPPEAPLVVHKDEEKEEPAIDADPASSDDDEPTASADIPHTIFVTTPKKETRSKVLENVTNAIRGNNISGLAKEQSESPDAKKAKEWRDEAQRELERKKKRNRGMKQKIDKSRPFSARISAASASANIHSVETEKPVGSRLEIISYLYGPCC